MVASVGMGIDRGTGHGLDSAGVYTDLSGLNAISTLGRNNTPAGLRKVAEQFESLFLNMMLKSMRQSNSSLFENNYLSSSEMQFHQENLDNQLSMTMSGAGGIGLADALYKQMLNRFAVRREEGPTVRVVPQQHPQRVASSNADVASDNPLISGPQDFVARLVDIARTTARRLGLDPRFLLAQSALETGWGKAVPVAADGRSSFNLFGVKADASWTGERVNVKTLEFRGGVMQQERASFRAYQSYEQSFADYVDFLESNPRYRQALSRAADSEAFATELQQAGYATDPQYASKLKDVMNSPVLREALAPARPHALRDGRVN